ncbi:MAG: chemotaxis protein CheA [Tepidisphaeraceae bacterium]
MTNELEDLLDRCASAAVLTQPGDLTALAQLHTDLQTIGARSYDKPESAAKASHASHIVESIVLGEIGDVPAALKAIGVEINAIQELVKAAASGSTAAKPAAATSAATPVAATHVEIPAEKEITEQDAPLVADFVGEATGHLDAAESSLLKLEDDPSDLAEVNAVFRAFHTIKGVAGFLELRQIGSLAHVAETLLDLARKGKMTLSGSRLDVILEARDVMKAMVSEVERAAQVHGTPGKQQGLGALLAKLDAAARGEEIAPSAPAAAPQAEADANNAPKADAASPAAAAVDFLKADDEHEEAPVAGKPAAAAATAAVAMQADQTVKVSTGRLDSLINTVGELVIAQAMVAQDLDSVAADQRLSRNLSQLAKITRSLQDLSMSMRMVPIAGVFQKMARLARDVSRKANKEVEFVQVGGETELDRNVVEAISDPLVHMVRNAIDHGLEFPEDRVKIGKQRAGMVTLKACHQAGNVVITITDDGRGLNKDKIVKKAITHGIIKEGQELTDQEIFQLIFHPGLSTADKLTDISGRGVGMDVVKKNVEALRGRIEIASTPGQGSVFTVRLPLTLAVIDGLIVKVGKQRYIVPITSIEQSIRPTRDQLSTVLGQGEMCLVRENLLPLIRLHRLFDVVPTTEDPTQALVVIVQDGPRRSCLLVDELIGQQQVVIKSVGKEIGQLPGIAGCAILGDGNVSLILDISALIESAKNN